MGVTVAPDAVVPVSTGAVAFNDDYQTPRILEGDPNGSTGAYPFAGPQPIVVDHAPGQSASNVAPAGPLTLEQWPNGVTTPAQDAAAATAAQAATDAPSEAAAKPARKRAARKPAKKAAAAPASSAGKGSPPAETKVVAPPKKAPAKRTGGARTKGK